MQQGLTDLKEHFQGDILTDVLNKIIYATDASAYREVPAAVTIPENRLDLLALIQFALKQKTTLIPRAGGTSLAGQVVGNGVVVDISRHLNRILELNVEERWVRVEPGVIRDDLNHWLRPHGLFFAPETSTANRAMIGGMIGNNSCGSNSIRYKSTREHLLEVTALLSDGSEVVFGNLTTDQFHAKCELPGREGEIYRHIRHMLSSPATRQEIEDGFPHPDIERRNTGYALDQLMTADPFVAGGPVFNFCKLLAGSEGTLAFITSAKLSLEPLPPPETGLLCVHFHSVDESLRANVLAVAFQPSACELIDHYILECTKDNREQTQNRFFVQGDPGAILVIEFCRGSREEIINITQQVEATLREHGLGYHFPVLFGADTKKIWTLRKAGLGLLSNLPGDEKAVPVIEDTAVRVEDLPAYIRSFNAILTKHQLHAVHYAHAGSGELHLRPIINLKTKEGHELFRTIATEVATLVQQYRGSLSGEHGDGRLRGEFIEQMVGGKNYHRFIELKNVWDPHHIFNAGKIVETPPMDSFLRYDAGQTTPSFKTYFRFQGQNILQHAEQCNGSGDCRKTAVSGGTMCPSYMATRNEKDTTRARANVLREYLTRSKKVNRFDHKEIYDVMDLCLSCKACKTECPSNVDMTKLKAEFTQQFYDIHGVPFRSQLIARFTTLSKFSMIMPSLYNWVITNSVTGKWIKQMAGFATRRSLPELAPKTLRNWMRGREAVNTSGRVVYFFCDEFTNYNDVAIGQQAILLLEALGYKVIIPEHVESGRTWLSKGLLKQAKKIIHRNIELLSPLVSDATPMIGLEPSAIISFRDEYLDLSDDAYLPAASELSKHVYLIDEFLAGEFKKGNIQSSQFTNSTLSIQLHGHCQQKALAKLTDTVSILSIPTGYKVKVIPSGCCGMAGSFGYEKEHYDVSMQIGELVLFPAVRNQQAGTITAAPGTSCRHQIKDGTGQKAYHPVEILYQALSKK
ncbi:MAG: FAD-binding and (Fe-S)-binding domain-containing protein [Sediminibacterium sp.]